MAKTLKEIVEAYGAKTPTGKALRKSFDQAPETVFSELSPAQQWALFPIDPEILKPFVQEEFKKMGPNWFGAFQVWSTAHLTGWKIPPGEYTAQDADWKDCLPYKSPAEYPDPQPRVMALVDAAGKAINSVPRQDADLTWYVIGQGFVRGWSSLTFDKLVPPGDPPSVLPIVSQFIRGTYRCGKIVATVTPSFVGKYQVRVINQTDGDLDFELRSEIVVDVV